MFAIIGIVLLVILLVGIPTFFYLDQGQKITAALVPWSTQEPSHFVRHGDLTPDPFGGQMFDIAATVDIGGWKRGHHRMWG